MSGVVETATRKPLAEMDRGSFASSFLTEDSSSFTTSGLSGGTYTVGRSLSAASRPVLTGNIRFQVLSGDLLELLDGVITSADQQA